MTRDGRFRRIVQSWIRDHSCPLYQVNGRFSAHRWTANLITQFVEEKAICLNSWISTYIIPRRINDFKGHKRCLQFGSIRPVLIKPSTCQAPVGLEALHWCAPALTCCRMVSRALLAWCLNIRRGRSAHGMRILDSLRPGSLDIHWCLPQLGLTRAWKSILHEQHSVANTK